MTVCLFHSIRLLDMLNWIALIPMDLSNCRKFERPMWSDTCRTSIWTIFKELSLVDRLSKTSHPGDLGSSGRSEPVSSKFKEFPRAVVPVAVICAIAVGFVGHREFSWRMRECAHFTQLQRLEASGNRANMSNTSPY
jgi:hypothetical protein